MDCSNGNYVLFILNKEKIVALSEEEGVMNVPFRFFIGIPKGSLYHVLE